MTRRMVYGIGLWVFLAGIPSPVLCSLTLANAFAAVALTFTSMALPSWISYTSPTTSSQKPIHVSYGLHRRCSSLSGSCTPFPVYEDCHGEDRYFCSMWRSVGFLMNFSVVLELATFVAFAVVLLGGRSNREGGWKMCVSMLGVVMVCQIAAMAIVAFLFDHDNRFFVGWKLDKSWILCTVSWVVLLFDIIGISFAAKMMPAEDDYEPIPDRR
ncbi:hypothetical protein D6D21_10447 [Aureobasidium pullulans]|uniref:Uncharacterized protein n=1 Tax=Aureobasidium pullulans TaxID=5580 RepID=A0AB74IIA9_AURPU|nr:hypothetical protein D6D21_10447 [Aureobasidium pullulans]